MANPKAKTLQQKFGFMDTDLIKPDHDALMLWLDSNIELVLNSKVIKEYHERETLRFMNQYLNYCKRENIEPESVALPLYQATSLVKRWEYPITTKSMNKFVVGFIDLFARYEYSGFSYSEDYRNNGRVHYHNDHADMYFEVKTEIRSAGELIRQIRMYQEYADYGKFCVVCPDDKFSNILQEQGILFVKATP